MRFVGIVFFVFYSIGLRGETQENRELDSLLTELKSIPDDTTKVFAYSRVSRLYILMRDHNDLALKYADSMLWLSENLHFEKGVVHAYYRHGEIEHFEGNYRQSIDHLSKYLRYYENKADSFQMVNALFSIGKSYKSLGEFDESLGNFFRAIRICERINDLDGAARAWLSISSIYRQMGNFKDAITRYHQANEIFKSLGKTKEYAMGLQNLANVYTEIKSYDTARLLYEQALVFIRKLDKKYEEAIILGSLGEFHENLDQSEIALGYHLQALSIRRQLPNKRSLAFGLLHVGKSYYKLNKYTEANKYLNEGLRLAKEIQSKDLLFSMYRALAEVSEASGDFKKAYGFATLSYQWNDSIYNEVSTKQLRELQTKYETEKKDQQIVVLSTEKELQEKEAQRQSTLKKAFIVGSVLVIIVAILVVYISRQRLKNQNLIAAKDNEIKEIDFKRQLSELEMRALRAQINPHFLFNCMNSINRMILNGENENASLYLTKFSKLVRLILENAEATKVSLNSELTLLESYIQLEELRFKGKIDYRISVDECIEKDNTYLPSMVLQPFVENAIWHGLMHKKRDEKGLIQIDIKEENDRLLCVIEDNGVGREMAQQLRGKSVLKNKSLGMKITEERLRLLSQERLHQLIQITDLKDALNHALGTRVEINIPIT